LARPRSDDKRDAILSAAARIFADRGLDAAPTAAISKAARVAEGTLFTYFATKDALINALYRAIKLEMAEAMIAGLARRKDGRSQLRHLWNGYVEWGIANPDKRKALTQLQVSDRITDESRAAGEAPFAEIEVLADGSILRREIRDLPLSYLGAAVSALADITMVFMAADAKGAARYQKVGFEILWNGIAPK
jgi:AcrR family transcriptional regulator